MKLFLKSAVYFTIFCLVIASLLQAVVLFRIKGKSVTGYDNLEQTAGINANLVLLGSSRCWAHFDPHFFENAYHIKAVNIGMDGHGEVQSSIVRLRNYLKKNKAPQFAILNIDPLVAAGSLKDNGNFVHKNYYSRYSFFPSNENEEFVDYFQFNYAEKYIPVYALFKNKLFLNCLSLQQQSVYAKYGYERHDEHWDTIANPVNDILKDKFITAKETPKLEAALNELIALCRQNKIKLMCIQTPAYKSIYDSVAFSKPAVMCRKLHIPFIDKNAAGIRNDISCFYNTMHLNHKGVEEMNALLEKDTLLRQFLNRKN